MSCTLFELCNPHLVSASSLAALLTARCPGIQNVGSLSDLQGTIYYVLVSFVFFIEILSSVDASSDLQFVHTQIIQSIPYVVTKIQSG